MHLFTKLISLIVMYTACALSALDKPAEPTPAFILKPSAVFKQSLTKAFQLGGTLNFSKYLQTSAWQVINGVTYLAVAGQPGNASVATQDNIRILSYDKTTEVLTPLGGFNHGATINSVAWFTINGSYYIVLGGETNTQQTTSVRILQFNPVNKTLSQIVSYNYTTRIFAVAAVTIGNNAFIAIGGQTPSNNTNQGQILIFNPTSSTRNLFVDQSFAIGNTIQSVSWNMIGTSLYLAVGGAKGTDGYEVRVLLYVSSTQSVQPTLSTEATYNTGNNVWAVAWYTDTLTSSYYLALAGGNGVTGSDIGVLLFDPVAKTLSQIASYAHGNITITLAWQLISGVPLLAIGGGKNNDIQNVNAQVLTFDASAGTLTPIDGTSVVHGNTIWSTSWAASLGNYFLALVGFPSTEGITIRILELLSLSVSLQFITSFFIGNFLSIASVSWNTISGSTYLAISGPRSTVAPINTNVRILQYTAGGTTVTDVGDYTYGTLGAPNTNGCDWLSTGGNNYVAIGGANQGAVYPQVQVLQFTPGALVYTGVGANVGLNVNANTVKWLSYNGSIYLAAGTENIGTPGNSKINVYQYTGAALNFIVNDTFDPIQTCDWIVINNIPYLAIGGTLHTVGLNTYCIYVYQFDPIGATLTLVGSADISVFPDRVYNLSWNTINNTPYLAACGGTIAHTYNVFIMQFDPATGLTLLPNATYNHGTSVRGLSWQSVSGVNLLAIGGRSANADNTVQVEVLVFDPGTVTLKQAGATAAYTYFTGAAALINSVSWQVIASNLYLGIGGYGAGVAPGTPPQVEILQATLG